MDVCVGKPQIQNHTVEAISSKSHVHRLLIASALAGSRTEITVNAVSEDIQATLHCLAACGVAYQQTEHEIVMNTDGIGVKPGKKAELHCRESGSTSRFLLPIAAAFFDRVTMDGAGKLPSRPFAPICEVMREHGCNVDNDFLPIHTEKRLQAGIYRIPGNISSQYISGLLFALPLLEEDSVIELTTPLQSAAYVQMTLSVLKQFQIEVIQTDSGYAIRGRQHYMSPKRIVANGDWSNAAFFFAVGALSDKTGVTNLQMDSLQGDKKILDILKNFGVEVNITQNTVTISPNRLQGVTVEASEIPDLIPVLAIIAATAKGRSVFQNVNRLRLKESDRVNSILALLHALGVTAYCEARDGIENLYIDGTEELRGAVVDGCNDHRIVMAAAVAACRTKEKITILGAQAVNKSYPGFFDIYGNYEIITMKQS